MPTLFIFSLYILFFFEVNTFLIPISILNCYAYFTSVLKSDAFWLVFVYLYVTHIMFRSNYFPYFMAFRRFIHVFCFDAFISSVINSYSVCKFLILLPSIEYCHIFSNKQIISTYNMWYNLFYNTFNVRRNQFMCMYSTKSNNFEI